MPDDLNPGTAAPADGGTPAATNPAPQDTQPAGDPNPEPKEPLTAAQAVPSLMDDGTKPEGGEGAPEGAPETYEAFKADTGEEFTPDQVKGFTEAAKELGLSQEKAQRMFGAMFPVASTYMRETHIKQVEAWRDATMVDKELGGEHLKANLGIAKMAYDKFASENLKKVLRASGLDNHPEMIRMFYHAGKALSQDTGVAGTAPEQRKHVRYPNSNMNEDL